MEDNLGFPATGTVSANASSGPSVLDVTVDYAVFDASVFTALFPASGYVPSGSLVYTYQVFVNDPPSTVGVSTEVILPVVSKTDFVPATADLGTGGVAPGFAFFGGGGNDATWIFNTAIAPGMNSVGLVYSSNNVPEFLGGSASSSGAGIVATVAVHVPHPTIEYVIPEPTAAGLAALTGLVLASARSRRG